MQSIRQKLKRSLSHKDQNANLDEYDDASDVDEETYGHLSRQLEKAEAEGHPQGRPGSFLNKLITHGNRKTDEQLAKEAALKNENTKPVATATTDSTATKS